METSNQTVLPIYYQPVKKEWLINGALTLGSIASFFLIIEFGLRITGLQTVKPNPPRIFQQSQNPSISYELIPNLQNIRAYRSRITTDEYGFRTQSPVPRTPYSLTPTFAVLGDSITFGYGVEGDETLPAQLELLMPEYRFLNAAVPGYTLEQEIATYKEKISDLDPEALMIVFYFNDLDGNPPGILDEDGILRGHDWTPTAEQCSPIERGILGKLPGKCWLDLHSAFYKAFKKLVNMRYNNQKLEIERKEAQTEPTEDSIEPKNLEKYISNLSRFVWALPVELPRTFVIWPDQNLHTESRKRLIEATEKLEFTVIDLYDTFGNEAKALGWDTVHPHKDTIKKAAEVIEAKIRKAKIPDL